MKNLVKYMIFVGLFFLHYGVFVAKGFSEKVIDELTFTPLSAEKVSEKIKTIASSEEGNYKAENAVDDNMNTRWSSDFSDPRWIQFDLGKKINLTGSILYWEAAFGKEYEVLLSEDGKKWNSAYFTDEGDGFEDDIDFKRQYARYVKILEKKRGTGWGYSLWEVVFKTEKEPFGMGKEEPGAFLKKKWNLNKEPIKEIFIPASWKGENILLWLGGISDDYTLFLNGKLVAKIDKNSKRPVKLDIGKYTKSGEFNQFSVKVKKTYSKTDVIDAMLFAKNRKSLSGDIL